MISKSVKPALSQDFFSRMLSLVDGSRDVDLCGVEGTKRSTQCYGFEFLWHVAAWRDGFCWVRLGG